MPDPSLRAVFWNDGEGRPRAFWRFGVALVLLVAAGVATLLGTSALAALAPSTAPATPTALFNTASALAPYVAFSAALVAAAHLVDRRRLRDLGLANSPAWWADCAFGLALGLVLPGVVLALELATGTARLTGVLVARPDPFLAVGSGVPFPLALALTFAFFVGVGAFEELLFRGYLLVNVAEGANGLLGTPQRVAVAGAVAVTSLAFGVVHGANPAATALALVNITLYGGFLAASYLLTDRIGVAIGFHVAWNFAVSSVFGFPVSGVTTPVTVLAIEVTGSPLLTGGEFGPEGGLVALVALIVACGALVAWVRWREGDLRVRGSAAVPDLRTK